MPSPSNGPLRAALHAAPIAAGLLVALLSGAPARAQYFIDEPEVRIPPRAVVANLVRRGYRDITHPSFDGETYTVEAENPRGLRVRLVIDAFDGAVIDRARAERPLVPPGFVGRPSAPGYGWTVDEPATEAPAPRRADRPRQPVPVAANPAAPALPAEARPGANPLGLNPDAARPARPADTKPAARAARAPETPKLAPEAKPIAPPAPTPPAVVSEPAKPTEPPRQEAARPAAPENPAEPAKPVEVPKPVEAAKETPKPSEAAASTTPKAEPVSEPPQRQVRIIEGVTPPTTSQATSQAAEPAKN